jgi:hypothetical protein
MNENKGKRKVILFVHSKHINLATMQPILQLIMCWLGVVLACQMKMQKDIVNLVAGTVFHHSSNLRAILPNVKTELNKRYVFLQTPLYSN